MNASAEKGLISALPSERSATLPLEAQFAVSAALGKDQPAYHVTPMIRADPASPKELRRTSLTGPQDGYQAANPVQHFDAHFDAQGACVALDGTHWNLSVREWGYGDPDLDQVEDYSYQLSGIRLFQFDVGRSALSVGRLLHPLSGVRRPVSGIRHPATPCVSANRVEYRRGALTEWYVNGPLGLQQGFTVNSPPTGRGPGSALLTLVLDLPAGGGQAKVDADRKGLTLLTDKGEPALRYSGLTALDADGRRLPAWLEARNHELLLRVDETKALYPITIDPFVQQAKLTASDGAVGDGFGGSAALSSDGNTVLIGASGADVGVSTNQGAGYVFTRSGSGWSEQAKLIASDGASNDWFGSPVALSSDGNTALIGASWADVVAGVGTNNSTNYNQGAAYVFTRGGGWSEQAKLIASDGATNDWFGSSVALSSDGNTAIIGASWADVGVSTNQGAVYVFTQGGGWSEQAKLIASDGAEGDYFGQVALSSDGNTALIGVHMSGYANQGAGYVFTRYLGNWSEQKKLTVAAWTAGDYFGWSVALNSDGNTALIGAYPAVVGSVMSGAGYVFTRSGTAWTQQATLTAADGAEWDDFGYSVALSSDGNTALIGALDADVGGNADQGAGYVFTRSGTSWSQQAKLAALDGTAYDYFGHSVALSGDGNTALITEPGWIYSTNQGAGYVFTVTASSKIGPIIKANGATNNVTVNYPETVSITVEMNADIYAGAEVDWWVVAYAHSVGCYYLNSAMQWTPFSGDLAFCRPVYQSALFNLSSTPVLSGFVLPRGTYDFWFAVDYPMDGVLDPNGQILYDKVTIVVQ